MSAGRPRVLSIVGLTALVLILGVFTWQIVGYARALIATGEPVGVGIGIAALVFPALAVGLFVREWQLARTVQRMADALAARGDLPVDDLPRSPGGRIDRDAADAAFPAARAAAEQEPDSWSAWYNLAFAYDAARDRKQARGALRRAAALYRAQRRAG